MNKDILTNYAVSQDANTVSFNGKVLKEANINLEDINYTLSFKIHIVNNLNQKFVYQMNLNVDLDDDNGGIYNGYVYRGKTLSGNDYRFLKRFKQLAKSLFLCILIVFSATSILLKIVSLLYLF